MTPDRLPAPAPQPAAPVPRPLPSDRLCAALLLARLQAAAHLSDAHVQAAAAQACMELRHSVTKAAFAAFLEKQREIDDRLHRAVGAFLEHLRAAGGPEGQAPDFADAAVHARFVELLAELATAHAGRVEVRP